VLKYTELVYLCKCIVMDSLVYLTTVICSCCSIILVIDDVSRDSATAWPRRLPEIIFIKTLRIIVSKHSCLLWEVPDPPQSVFTRKQKLLEWRIINLKRFSISINRGPCKCEDLKFILAMSFLPRSSLLRSKTVALARRSRETFFRDKSQTIERILNVVYQYITDIEMLHAEPRSLLPHGESFRGTPITLEVRCETNKQDFVLQTHGNETVRNIRRNIALSIDILADYVQLYINDRVIPFANDRLLLRDCGFEEYQVWPSVTCTRTFAAFAVEECFLTFFSPRHFGHLCHSSVETRRNMSH